MKNRLSDVNYLMYLIVLFLCFVTANGQWDWDGRLMDQQQGGDWDWFLRNRARPLGDYPFMTNPFGRQLGGLGNYLGNVYGTVVRNVNIPQWTDSTLAARGRNYFMNPVRTPDNGWWYGNGGRFSHGPVVLPGNIRVSGSGQHRSETRTWGNRGMNSEKSGNIQAYTGNLWQLLG